MPTRFAGPVHARHLSPCRIRLGWLLAVLLSLAMPTTLFTPPAGAQTAPPTSSRSELPVTAEPRYPPTPLPKDEPDDEDEQADEAPPAAPEGSATPPPPGFALPARTQRPTRTPRATSLPTPTPLAAGGLRLTFSAAPPVLLLGESATFTLDLVNQGDLAVDGMVVDVAAPDVLIAFEAQVRSGEVSRAGNLLSWHLLRFAPGERSSLRLNGRVARAGSERTGICATLISSGAALEHCASYEVLSSRPAAATIAPSARQDAPDGLAARTAPSGAEALRQAGRPGLLAGFTLLLAGIGLLGAWWARARLPLPAIARSPIAGTADPTAVTVTPEGPSPTGPAARTSDRPTGLQRLESPDGTPTTPSKDSSARQPRRGRRGSTK